MRIDCNQAWKYPKTGCGPGISLPKIIELLSYSVRTECKLNINKASFKMTKRI